MIALALSRGLAAIFRPRLLFAFWLLNVLLALSVALPYQQLVESGVSQVPASEGLAVSPAPPWADDLRRREASALTALGTSAGLAGWAYLLVGALLMGGLVRALERRAAERRLAEGEAWSYRTFLADSGTFAFRMLRLLLIMLVLAFALDWLFNTKMVEWHGRWLVDIENERWTVLSDWLREGLFLGCLFLLAAWADVARVQVVVERRRSVLAGLVSAAHALLERPGALLGVGGFFVALEWLVMALGAGLLAGVRTDSMSSLATWLILAQLMVLLRLGLGFARVGAYTAVAEELRDERESRLRPAGVGA